MDVILIPGFWLTASSWREVIPPLESAGLRVHALTLPGLEPDAPDAAAIRLQDHVDAVVASIDALPAPVVLVGHSGGGAIAYAAADARPDRVARVVYVDSGPLADGGVINDGLPVEDGVIPLPDWSLFEEADLRDLDEGLRERFRREAVRQPAQVASDPQTLRDTRRRSIPATVIACQFGGEELRAWMETGHPYVSELAALEDVEIIDLPTGHWPQFTRPGDLAAALLRAVGRGAPA